MEEGYKHWPIMRKMLIDNRLEHAAMLAYSVDVSEVMFIVRARSAYRKVELRVTDAVVAAADAAQAVRDKEEAAEAIKARADAKTDDKAEPGVAVTIDRVTPEPPKTEE